MKISINNITVNMFLIADFWVIKFSLKYLKEIFQGIKGYKPVNAIKLFKWFKKRFNIKRSQIKTEWFQLKKVLTIATIKKQRAHWLWAKIQRNLIKIKE